MDDQDRVKPGLDYYLEFSRSIQDQPAPQAGTSAVGIYLPKHYYPRDEPLNPGNDPRQFARWLILANYMVQRAGYRTHVVRGDRPLDPTLRTLVIPGLRLTADELDALEPWVRSGGRLIWHGPDPVNWGPRTIRLLGAAPVDYRSARAAQAMLYGQTWTLEHYPRGMRLQVTPGEATVVAEDDRGLPIVLQNRVGVGTVLYALPLVEQSIVPLADDPLARDRWVAWYRGALGAP